MQPSQFTGLGGLPIQSHDLRDPRRAAHVQQTLYAQPGATATPAAQPGNIQYGAGVVMASLAPQQLGLSVAYSQPGALRQLGNFSLLQPFGATLALTQPSTVPQQQMILQQQLAIQQQQSGLQLQCLAPQPQPQQPVWNLTSIGPSGQNSGSGLQLQQLQTAGAAAPRPMTVAPSASPAAPLLGSNASIQQITASQVLAGLQPQQQQQQGQQQAPAQQQQSSPAGTITHSSTAPGPSSVGGTGANATPVGGGSGGNAAGPRPMKRQAYQGLQGNSAKRQQQQRGGLANRSVGYRPVYAPCGDDEDGPTPRTAVATKPFPGVVQMLADTQQLLLKIMLYMVKHSQFRPSQHSGRAEKQGYDLCKLKADFLNEYKYEMDTKAFG